MKKCELEEVGKGILGRTACAKAPRQRLTQVTLSNSKQLDQRIPHGKVARHVEGDKKESVRSFYPDKELNFILKAKKGI